MVGINREWCFKRNADELIYVHDLHARKCFISVIPQDDLVFGYPLDAKPVRFEPLVDGSHFFGNGLARFRGCFDSFEFSARFISRGFGLFLSGLTEV